MSCRFCGAARSIPLNLWGRQLNICRASRPSKCGLAMQLSTLPLICRTSFAFAYPASLRTRFDESRKLFRVWNQGDYHHSLL